MKITVLSGAGISAESGISTFRESGGLWEKYDISEVATPEAFFNNPKLVLDFYNQRRIQLLEVEPNLGHLEIAKWESFSNVNIITQNIDDLHERAGSSNILHLHGELLKAKSSGPNQLPFSLKKPIIELGDLCEEGHQIRPHVVWFGESVPEMDNAESIIEETQMLIIVGTSLNVYPAASLAYSLPKSTPIYIVDPSPLDNLPPNAIHIKEKASTGLKKVTDIILHRTKI